MTFETGPLTGSPIQYCVFSWLCCSFLACVSYTDRHGRGPSVILLVTLTKTALEKDRTSEPNQPNVPISGLPDLQPGLLIEASGIAVGRLR